MTEGDALLLIALLALSAFFSASEVAFLAVGRARAKHLAETHRSGGHLLLKLHRRRSYVLATVLVLITGSHYLAERIATLLSIRYIGPSSGPIVAFVVMTVVVLIFCEITPIQLATRRPETVALAAARPLALFGVLLAPLVVILSAIVRGLLLVMGVRRSGILPTVTEDEIKAMIEQSEAEGALEPAQRRMLHGALDFGDQTAAQVMTPRTDMICVQANQTLGEALDTGLAHKHSRLPVYEGSVDNIIGVLHLKDLLPYARRGELDKPVRLVARAAHHVPESLPASDLLRELQRRHRMVAIVRDEFGGTAGLVTVEDLLEEIVGEIRDEYDEVQAPEVQLVAEDEWLCDGRASLFALQNHVAQDLPAEDYDSLAGWLVDLAGHIPTVGEQVVSGNLTLAVEVMEGNRVETVRVRESHPQG